MCVRHFTLSLFCRSAKPYRKRDCHGLDAKAHSGDNTHWSGTSKQVWMRTPFEP
jgi:hypothetical protein